MSAGGRSVIPDPNLQYTSYHILLSHFCILHLLQMISPLRAGTMSHPSYAPESTPGPQQMLNQSTPQKHIAEAYVEGEGTEWLSGM